MSAASAVRTVRPIVTDSVYWTIQEGADYGRVTTATIYRRIQEGKLQLFQNEGRSLLLAEEVRALVKPVVK